MKKLKYILFLIIGLSVLSSCFKDEAIIDLNDDGLNVVTFDRIIDHMTGVAEDGGSVYTFFKRIRLVGPTASEITSDISVTFEVASGSTSDGTMYQIMNPTIILTKTDNYLGLLEIKLTTLGNEPPAEGTPEYDSYVAPVLKLSCVATGDARVVGSGKPGIFTLNFTPRNPWAGDYSAHIIYRRPGDGATGVYPNNINIEETNNKTLVGITARKCETWAMVSIFGEPYTLAWITVNADNSIKYAADNDYWGLDILNGDPNDSSLLSHYDPITGKLFVYYHYVGSSGPRIFWETFTPKF